MVGRVRTLLAAAWWIAASTTAANAAELQPGDVLGQENWNLADDALPPEILRHYREGHYRNEIARWPDGVFEWDTAFAQSTKENTGRFRVNEHGTIIDKTTGEQPEHIYGFPFPEVTADDPEAGIKILWNSYYGYWYLGNSHNEVRLSWVNPDGIDREAGQDVYFKYYDGQPADYRVDNPQNFLMKFVSAAMYPTDLYGTTALTWRYRDSRKRDSNWAYVPALRRVRAVSPANRSDGFLGSDMSSDDGPFFDGKPEDFTWRLAGEVEWYRYADPLSLQGESDAKWLSDGGWRAVWPDMKVVGYEDPNWTGVAWAPVGPALAKRKLWKLEAVPKDQYYLYGKVELYVDQETYQGAYNRKYAWSGELLNTYIILGMLNHKRVRPDGMVEYLWGSNMGYQAAENLKLNRATVSGQLAPGNDRANDRRVPFEERFFEFSTLSRFGK